MAEHRAASERRLAGYRELAQAEGLDPYQQATVSFGLHYEQAVLAWTEELPTILAAATA